MIYVSVSSVKKTWRWLAICIIWLLAVQIVFHFVESNQINTLSKTIQSQLRQELDYSNFQFIARSLSDLEATKTISCVTLILDDFKQKTILDLTYKEECKPNIRFFNFDKNVNIKLLSLNGDSYFLSFKFVRNFTFLLALWILRVSGVALVFGFYYYNKIKSEKEKIINLLEKSYANKLIELAQQVAHDIRSPLSSLNMISSTLTNLQEEQKNILTQSISRINSIANDLLEKGKGNFEDSKINLMNSSSIQNKFYLLPMVKDIITEKRAQYKNKSDVFILFNNHDNIDELISFPKSELERILSNIINNATESLIDAKGEIEVSLNKTDSKFNYITIKDNGKGIPKDILSKIGQKGFSYGKEHSDQSGSGLGLYHAKKTMLEFGGELLIDSELGKGTTITLKIPLADQQ